MGIICELAFYNRMAVRESKVTAIVRCLHPASYVFTGEVNNIRRRKLLTCVKWPLGRMKICIRNEIEERHNG